MFHCCLNIIRSHRYAYCMSNGGKSTIGVIWWLSCFRYLGSWPVGIQVFTVYPKKYAHGFCFLCFVVVIHWLIFPYPSRLFHWHCGNLTIAPVPAKQPWWIWINTSCKFIMNDCITTTKQSTTKPCAYFLGYTVDGENVSGCKVKPWVDTFKLFTEVCRCTKHVNVDSNMSVKLGTRK